MKAILLALVAIIYSCTSQAQDIYVFDSRVSLDNFLKSMHNVQPMREFANSQHARLVSATEKLYASSEYYIIYHHLGGYYYFPSTVDLVNKDIQKIIAKLLSDPHYKKLYNQKEIEVEYVFAVPGKPLNMEPLIKEGKDITSNRDGNDFEKMLNALEKKSRSDPSGALYGLQHEALDFYLNKLGTNDAEVAKQFQNLREGILQKLPPGGVNMNAGNVSKTFAQLTSDREKEKMAAQEGKAKGGAQTRISKNGLKEDGNGTDDASLDGKKDGEVGTSSSKGLSGPFNIKIPFPKWAAVIIKSVAKYLGIEQIAYKMLALAYMIAPEIFDYVGSFLANVIHAVTPDSLEDCFDTIADIIQNFEKFLKYAQMIYDLVSNPDFQKLFKSLDLNKIDVLKIANEANNVELIPDKYFDKAKDFLPLLDLKHVNTSIILDVAKKNAVKYGSKFLDQGMQKLNFPVSFSTLTGCMNKKGKEQSACAKEWGKQQTINVVARQIPYLKDNREAINHLLRGGYESAAISAAAANIGKAFGVPASSVESMFESLTSKDYKEFIIKAAKSGLNKYNDCSPSIIQEMKAGKIANMNTLKDISSCILQHAGQSTLGKGEKNVSTTLLQWSSSVKQNDGLNSWIQQQGNYLKNQLQTGLEGAQNFSKQQIKDFLQGGGEQVMNKRISTFFQQELKLTFPQAQEILNSGNILRAIEYAATKKMAEDNSEELKQKIDWWLQYLRNLNKKSPGQLS